MKSLLVTGFLLLPFAGMAQMQCDMKATQKGQSLIINKSCWDNMLNSGIDSKLTLGPQGRIKLAAALRKGLDWASINRTQHLSFKKIITEFPAKGTVYDRAGFLNLEYSGVGVVFQGNADGTYEIVVAGNANTTWQPPGSKPRPKMPLDIDSVGRDIISFNTPQQVDEIIKLLEKQPENLDAIFK